MRREVLSERPGPERTPQPLGPPRVVLDRIRVHGFVAPTVHPEIGLTVADDVLAAHGDTPVDRLLPDRGLHVAPVPLDHAR